MGREKIERKCDRQDRNDVWKQFNNILPITVSNKTLYFTKRLHTAVSLVTDRGTECWRW